MDITKKDGKYTLNALTVNGVELDRNKTYSLIIYGDRDWYMTEVMDKIGITSVDTSGLKAEGYLIECLVNQARQLDAPSKYITLR